MMLLSFMIQHYFSIRYEDFTAKIISAYALLKAVDKVSDDDISEIEWIQKNTHKDINVSLWKLDRAVNPSKGEFKLINNKRSFKMNDVSDDDCELGLGNIVLNEDSIQHYLCEAINRIHEIVVKNIKSYKEEIPFDSFLDSSSDKKGGVSFGFT